MSESPSNSDAAPDLIKVRWKLAIGTSSMITRAADLLGCLAQRDGILSEVLEIGLEELVILRCAPVDVLPAGRHAAFLPHNPFTAEGIGADS